MFSLAVDHAVHQGDTAVSASYQARKMNNRAFAKKHSGKAPRATGLDTDRFAPLTIKAWKKKVAHDKHALEKAPPNVKGNMDIVKVAVRHFGMALKYVPEWHDFPPIVDVASANNVNALMYCSANLRNNGTFMWQQVGRNGVALQFGSDAIKSNPEIVMAAVQNNGNALQYAHNSLKVYTEGAAEKVVTYRAPHDTHLSECSFEELQFMIAEAAVTQNPYAIQFVDEHYHSRLALQAVEQDFRTLRYISWELMEDDEFMEDAIKINIGALDFLGSPEGLYRSPFTKRMHFEDFPADKQLYQKYKTWVKEQEKLSYVERMRAKPYPNRQSI